MCGCTTGFTLCLVYIYALLLDGKVYAKTGKKEYKFYTYSKVHISAFIKVI